MLPLSERPLIELVLEIAALRQRVAALTVDLATARGRALDEVAAIADALARQAGAAPSALAAQVRALKAAP